MSHRMACAAVAVAVVLAACSNARQVSSGVAADSCTRCHGGTDNATGAPPHDVAGRIDPGLPSVGAHTAHLNAGTISVALTCGDCHPDPRFDSSRHLDGTVELSFGGAATAGGRVAPRFDPVTSRCSDVYCHGAFKGGNKGNAPVWTKVGQSQAGCGTCHGLPPPPPHPAIEGGVAACGLCHPLTVDASGSIIAPADGGKHLDGVVDVTRVHDGSWMVIVGPGFHAYSANRGLGECQRCHGEDLGGGSTGFACASCHGTGWKTNCLLCHGGGETQTGAPPKATWGNDGDAVRIGAHTSHVTGSSIAGPFECGVCHVTPADALSPGHIDGAAATLTWGGLAVTGGATPSWDRASATCSGTYCHGAFKGGNANNVPVWTSVGQGQADCGTCHDLPPPATHPGVSTDRTGCRSCHSLTLDASGNVLPGGKHLDGHIDGRHDDSWMDPASASFHGTAAGRGLSPCQGCHGDDLGGGLSGVACAQCHGTGPASCTSCHEDVVATDGVRSSHVTGFADAAIGCQGCHAASQRTGGHFDRWTGGGSSPDSTCTDCHAGRGLTLVAQTPPLLVGWSDAVSGDFHGARPGTCFTGAFIPETCAAGATPTGFGGTLSPPYIRGFPPIPCETCHEHHSSANAFLLASTVNGTSIPAGAIDRAGVGAEALCSACHQGDRHGACGSCHRAGTMWDDSLGTYVFDPSTPPIDPTPAGSPCFFCHGHEGLLNWTSPYLPPGTSHGVGAQSDPVCRHCHGFAMPPISYASPKISQYTWSQPNSFYLTNQPDPQVWLVPNGTVYDITPTSASIYWETSAASTSYVEYGVNTAGYVAGDDGYAWYHLVTLTGLTPDTTYVWRIRTSDVFRKVTEPPLQTFTTLGSTTVPHPTPVPVGGVWSADGSTTAVATLSWSPVTAPSGNPVQYRAVLSGDADFATAAPYASSSDSGWIDDTSYSVTLSNLPDECVPPGRRDYYWRVMARDSVLGTTSDWSFTDWLYGVATDSSCW